MRPDETINDNGINGFEKTDPNFSDYKFYIFIL